MTFKARTRGSTCNVGTGLSGQDKRQHAMQEQDLQARIRGIKGQEQGLQARTRGSTGNAGTVTSGQDERQHMQCRNRTFRPG
jgi:hypothetical protein